MKRRSTINLNNVYKLIFLILTCIVLFGIFLYFYNKESNYETKYEINDTQIIEKYDKDKKYYEFLLTYDKTEFNIISLDGYVNKRNLIKNIKIEKDENNTCIIPESDEINVYGLCQNKEGFYFDIKEQSFKETSSYENIKINDLDDKTYMLWNYHEFLYLNSKKQSKISLFNKDIYSLNLIYQNKDSLIIPNYNQEYTFDKLYIISSQNAKVKDINLRYEVYFDSYFLGQDEDDIYLYDSKQSQEFYIDLKKEKINKTGYKILVDNKWEKVSNQKLKNNKLKFSNTINYDYILKDKTLYLKIENNLYKVRNNVDKLVFTNNLDVYYIIKDTLYTFNPLKKEKSLLKYSEWEFNNNNMIFIFNN